MEVSVNYENIFDFVLSSESTEDFYGRMAEASLIVIKELSIRLENCYFPFFATEIIDDLQDEVDDLIAKINNSNIVPQQPVLSSEFFKLMIRFNNPLLYKDYCLTKYVLPN